MQLSGAHHLQIVRPTSAEPTRFGRIVSCSIPIRPRAKSVREKVNEGADFWGDVSCLRVDCVKPKRLGHELVEHADKRTLLKVGAYYKRRQNGYSHAVQCGHPQGITVVYSDFARHIHGIQRAIRLPELPFVRDRYIAVQKTLMIVKILRCTGYAVAAQIVWAGAYDKPNGRNTPNPET